MHPFVLLLVTFAIAFIVGSKVNKTIYKLITSFKPRKVPDGCRALPGPKGLPLLGPVNKIGRNGAWITFSDWAKEFGPIYSITILGKTHVFLATQSIAKQLLESRSTIYSGRPSIPTVEDSQSHHGTAEYLPLMSKNNDHKRHKQLNHIGIIAASKNSYYHYPAIEAKRFLFRMMQDSTNWTGLTEDMTSRVICRLSWGTPDHFKGLQRDAWNLLVHISPAGFLTNLVPLFLWLPYSCNPWKRAEKKRHDMQRAWFIQNMLEIKQKMVDGGAGPSYMRSFLESAGKGPVKDLYEGAFAIGMLAVTAVFTVSSPMQTFVRAAVLFPDWYRKVQQEVDTVCGRHRLPEVSDMENLPILRAFLQECLRWRPAIPGGIPHELESKEDDIYDGYVIPAGAIIHPLEYAITHDPALYPSPDSFNPARWLDPAFPTTYREPLTVHPRIIGFSTFGWGRRYCQGQELTAHELVVACGGLAWAFDITARGEAPCANMERPEKWEESLIIVKPGQFDIDCVLRQEWRGEVVAGAYEASKGADVDVLRGFGAVETE